MKIKMNPIAEIESLQSSTSKSMQLENVNDKEICAEGESSSDDDNME